MTTTTTVSAIVLDCADPAALADFYRRATGWKETSADDVFVYLSDGGPIQLAFQRVADYRPPTWPGNAKHAHVDLRVDDVARAEKDLLALGATKPDYQPGDGWTVLLDPAGHPFCIAA
jgi:catechol 2,3-dioxygenase-like lactoylglutathione lyase family enzyme